MLSNRAQPVAVAWQVWLWDAVKSRSAGSSCVAGVALDVVKSRSAGQLRGRCGSGMLSNRALPVAVAWQVWLWDVVNLRCAGGSCVAGVVLGRCQIALCR